MQLQLGVFRELAPLGDLGLDMRVELIGGRAHRHRAVGGETRREVGRLERFGNRHLDFIDYCARHFRPGNDAVPLVDFVSPAGRLQRLSATRARRVNAFRGDSEHAQAPGLPVRPHAEQRPVADLDLAGQIGDDAEAEPLNGTCVILTSAIWFEHLAREVLQPPVRRNRS